MHEHIIIAIVVIALIYLIYYREPKAVVPSPLPPSAPTSTTVTPSDEESFIDWDESILNNSVDKGVVASHAKYVANVRDFSNGASFTQTSDDNTSSIFTNYIGFYRPTYVEVGTTARQVPDVDTTVLKRNHNPLHNLGF